MKKKIVYIILFLLMLFPLTIFAEEYTPQTLLEACTEEGIEFNHSNYVEDDSKVNIYLFRGSGCSHCHDFLNYLESIVDEYGDKFNVVSFETWNDSNNAALMNKVAAFRGETASGVPYIVIGDKSFAGYADSMQQEVITAIETEYNNKDKYDVLKKMEKGTSSASNNDALIIIILVFSIIFDGVLFYKTNKDKNELNEKINKLENKLKKSK